VSEDKLSAIFEAALELFASHGYEKATMDGIAAKAKVAKGTIFYHYKSKEDLFNHMIQRGIDRLIATIRERLSSHADPLEKLKEVIRVQTTLLYKHPQFFRILLSEVWGQQDRQTLIWNGLSAYFRLLEEIVAEGVEKGRLRNVNPSTVADVIFGMTSTAAVHLLKSRDQKPLEETIHELQSVLVAGVSPEA
jgi:TetR/AcrR family transcriptional regulator